METFSLYVTDCGKLVLFFASFASNHLRDQKGSMIPTWREEHAIRAFRQNA